MTLAALRYMTRFQCIAERCEDTCCCGLRVPLTPANHAALRSAMTAPTDRAQLATALVEVDPAAPDAPADVAAFLQPRADGLCPFFDPDRLCSLQRRFGEAVLSDACAQFPRVLTRVGEQVELSGSLACPEVARLCLLGDDGEDPLALGPGEPAALPRPDAVRAIDPATAAGDRFAEIRAAGLRLHATAHPVADQLVLLAYLAYPLGDLLAAEPPAPGSDAEARLRAQLAAVDAPETQQAALANVAPLRIPAGTCGALIAGTLRGRLDHPHPERFALLANGVLDAFGDGGDPDDLWARYTARRDALDARFGARVQTLLRRYCAHRWYRHPFTESPHLLGWAFDLTVRTAQLRLALAGHPKVSALLDAGDEGPEAEATLDAAAVEAAQLLAKYVETGERFRALTQHGAEGPASSVFGKLLLFAQLC